MDVVGPEKLDLKTELLASLSHQIRTPLAAIKGYATTLLREDVNWTKQSQREFLEAICQQVDMLTSYVTDVLDNTVIESAGLQLTKEPVLIRHLCERVVHDAEMGAPRHRLTVLISPDFPIVQADPLQIEQVLRNLVDNAIKYSDGGLIVVSGRVEGDHVLMGVSDQGIGIKPEHLNRLFEPYYRVKTARRVMGTGLGLAIARKIVEAHGGAIWATSEVGSGSTFYLTLPLEG